MQFFFLLVLLLSCVNTALALVIQPPPSLTGISIWAANSSSDFVFLRSTDFTLRSPTFINATLYFSALGSPRPPAGTIQSKLLGAASIYLNSVLVTSGPGHNTPTNSTAVRAVDMSAFLRGNGEANTIGIISHWARAYAKNSPLPGGPRVSATLIIFDANGSYPVSATSLEWSSWGGDIAYNPTGNAGVSWYPFSNENMQRNEFPSSSWSSPSFALPVDWVPAIATNPFPLPLILIDGIAPVTLTRNACSVTTLSPSRQIVDFGTEMMGGVNFSFAGSYAGSIVRIILGEELRSDGTVYAPMRTGNFWTSNWTLSVNNAQNLGIVSHEFIQFRYVQVDYFNEGTSSVPRLTVSNALAWVIQHGAGGTGENPWEIACSRAVPSAVMWGRSSPPPPSQARLGNITSSSIELNKVWSFSASTIISTSLDVNVDGQTRERDIDVVDALNTARGQYSVFSTGDILIAERTAREILGNDTGGWSQWYDFKASTVMLVRDHVKWTGAFALAIDAWGSDDTSIRSGGDVQDYNSLQFYSGLAYYWNASGNGLFHFPSDGSCKGSWACEPLVDWPVSTRDGYDCSKSNSDDTVRSSLGALALDSLADLAKWLPNVPIERYNKYMNAANSVRTALYNLNLRHNGSEAYFVDGAVGPSSLHAAVHSTVYAVAAGAADGDAVLGTAIAAYLKRHGVAPASCMMGRWFVDALYRIGIWSPEASDVAFDILTATAYPSWIDMINQGATTTMEAWRPADKSNLDWAHPWCASPSFTIPAGTVGAVPLEPGWIQWRLAPQPSSLNLFNAAIPTPQGLVDIEWMSGGGNSTVTVTVLEGQMLTLCLPREGRAASSGGGGGGDLLYIDGQSIVNKVIYGRMLCGDQLLGVGLHTATRVVVASE